MKQLRGHTSVSVQHCAVVFCIAYMFLLFALYGQYSQRLKALPASARAVSVTETKAPQATVTAYGTEQGLPLSSFYAGIKDSKGNLWFGTFGGGVSRYDGRSFRNFNTSHGLAHNVVSSITEDRYGDLWFATLGGGVSRFDGIKFTTFTTRDGLPENMIRNVFQDSKGNLWFGTLEGGISRYDGKTFTNYSAKEGLINNKVWCFEEDKNGLIYVGTDLGVSVFNGTQFAEITGLKGKAVRTILADSHGNIWYGTFSDGLVRTKGEEVSLFTKRHGLSDNSILTAIEDRYGKVWFGTEQGGVISYDGKQFSSITTEQGLTHNSIRSIVEDNRGSLWFATYGGGINRYDGEQITLYGPAQGFPTSQMKDVLEDDLGNLWFASYEIGLVKFDGKNASHFTIANGLKTNSIRKLMQDRNNNIWLGTSAAGLCKFDGTSFTHFNVSSGLPNNTVVSLCEDSSGKLWIGTDGGLALFDGKRFKSFTTDDGLANNAVWDILQDKHGNFWFGTFGGGVSFYDGSTFKTYDKTHGLCDNTIFCMLEDSEGNIWVGGTGGGLSRFDGKTFLTFTKSDGIPDETIYDIIETDKGELWIGTNLGLTKLSFIGKDNSEVNAAITAENSFIKKNFTFRWDSYNFTTGYPIKDINSGSMLLKEKPFPNGMHGQSLIWAATGDNKLVCFDPGFSKQSASPPVVFLNDLKLNDQDICWYTFQKDRVDTATLVQQEMLVYGRTLTPTQRDTLKRNFGSVSITGLTKFSNIPTRLVLPGTIGRLTFDFNAVETSQYELVNYQYKLEGQDDDWGPPVKATQATYSNLWEGSYVFKVRAQREGGVWGEPIVYTFAVSPPWWRERWMYAIYLISFAWMIVAFVRLRERKLKNEKLVLEILVNERVEDVVLQTKEAEAQKQEAQNQKLEAEKQRLLVEEKNEQIVRQISAAEASLSNLTLQMIQRFHSFNELEKELRKLAAESEPTSYQRAFSLIATTRSLEKEWEQFDAYFSRVHKNFDLRLQENDQLSVYERRMCALIKMGFENREIAMLLNIETASVKMAKYRLKKKFQIDEKVDLQTYFESL